MAHCAGHELIDCLNVYFVFPILCIPHVHSKCTLCHDNEQYLCILWEIYNLHTMVGLQTLFDPSYFTEVFPTVCVRDDMIS